MNPTFELFAQVCVAIVLEATPFLLLGSLVSGAFEVFTTGEGLRSRLPKSPLAGALLGAVLGMAVPCCECGVVPLVRRMLARGLPPAAVFSFMLAGPVLNPVVIASTWVAFPTQPSMVLARCLLVWLLAVTVGLVLGRRTPGQILLTPREAPGLFGSLNDAVGLEAARKPALAKRLGHALDHALTDFLQMGRMLILGALVAAAFKVLAPDGLMGLLEKDLLLAVTAMMLLAIVLSLCSQADAFVAASFAGFPFAAKLAFLALGPVLDFKLVLMWSGVFRPDVIRILIAVPAGLVFCACLVLGWVLG